MYVLIQNRSFTIIFYVMLVRTKFWGFQFPKCLQCLACFEAKFEARRGSVECQVCIISGFSMCSKAFRQTVETTRSRPLSIQAYVGETRPKSVDDDAIGTFYDYFFYLTEKNFSKHFEKTKIEMTLPALVVMFLFKSSSNK